MARTHKGWLATILLFLILYLAVVPVLTHAAGTRPKPTSSCTVPAETPLDRLRILLSASDRDTVAVLEPDGSVRESGCVEDGDYAVICGPDGNVQSCFAISVGLPSSAASSVLPSSAQEIPPGSASGGSGTSASGSSESIPPILQDPVFKESISISGLPAALNVDASRVAVFSSGGVRRADGLVCTGDTVTVTGKDGAVLCTATVTVLGDLTQCGKTTQDGCDLLYRCLSNGASLPDGFSAAADMNRDGKVDTGDLLLMKKKLAETGASSAASGTP